MHFTIHQIVGQITFRNIFIDSLIFPYFHDLNTNNFLKQKMYDKENLLDSDALYFRCQL